LAGILPTVGKEIKLDFIASAYAIGNELKVSRNLLLPYVTALRAKQKRLNVCRKWNII
jgi:hypothetical protein